MTFNMIGWSILCLVIVAGVAYRVKNALGTLTLVACGLLAAWLCFLIITGGV
jgi:hypothetical protein